MRKNEIGKEELSLFVCAATSASDFHNFFLAPSVILLLCGKIHKKNLPLYADDIFMAFI